MKKAYLFLTILVAQSLNALQVTYTIDDITYESLAKNDWTDHVRAFRCLFSVQKISSFLDFGTGKGSKFFLENCDHLTSYEISTSSRNMSDWYQASLKAYASYKNWTPIHIFASENFDNFNIDYGRNYHDINLRTSTEYAEYLLEVQSICDAALNMGPYDVAFVDPGIITRADFVNCLLGRVDIIVAHDTNDWVYGWERIEDNLNYEKIRFPRGCGVDFWIKKDRQELINALKTEITLHMEDAP